MHHDVFTEHQAFLCKQVAFHVFWINDKVLQNVLGFFQRGSHHVACTRNSLPLREEAAPIPFHFADHAFYDRRGDAADISEKRQDIFQNGRIAFMRHGGGTDFAHEERFF